MLQEYNNKGLNRYKRRLDRYSGNVRYHIDTFDEFIFKNITSKNLSEERFTNKIQRKSNSQYEEIFFGIANDPNYLFKKFISDELLSGTVSDRKKLERLQRIINSYDKEFDIFNNPPLKFKNLKNNAFQLYIRKEEQNLVLYLIDLYHLGIIPKKNRNGQNFNLIEEYRYKSGYRHCISEVINVIFENEEYSRDSSSQTFQ